MLCNFRSNNHRDTTDADDDEFVGIVLAAWNACSNYYLPRYVSTLYNQGPRVIYPAWPPKFPDANIDDGPRDVMILTLKMVSRIHVSPL